MFRTILALAVLLVMVSLTYAQCCCGTACKCPTGVCPDCPTTVVLTGSLCPTQCNGFSREGQFFNRPVLFRPLIIDPQFQWGNSGGFGGGGGFQPQPTPYGFSGTYSITPYFGGSPFGATPYGFSSGYAQGRYGGSAGFSRSPFGGSGYIQGPYGAGGSFQYRR